MNNSFNLQVKKKKNYLYKWKQIVDNLYEIYIC